MRVCNTALKDSTPLVTHAPPPPEAVAELREYGRKARLFGVATDDPVIGFLARLPDALGRKPVFFHPTSPEISFDEAWLLNLFDAVKCNDHDRYCFAMRSRMSRSDSAELHFFAMKAANALDI